MGMSFINPVPNSNGFLDKNPVGIKNHLKRDMIGGLG